MTTLESLQKELIKIYLKKGKGLLEFSDDLELMTIKGFSRERALVNLALRNNIEIEEISELEKRGLTRKEAILRFAEELKSAQNKTRKFSEVLRSAPSEGYSLSYSPSSLWYLLPIFLGFFGGIVAYVYVRDDDPEMAKDLFTTGIIVSIIIGILLYVFGLI